MRTVSIIPAETEEHLEIARQLLLEYQQWLGFDLCFQGFEQEVSSLPGKYAPPAGRLFLAFVGDTPAGMIAMRPIDAQVCEMKRLYVRPEARGHSLGKRLISTLMAAARAIGYSRMRLDTVAGTMDHAIALYREFGFREIAPYYETPLQHTLFLEADLRAIVATS